MNKILLAAVIAVYALVLVPQVYGQSVPVVCKSPFGQYEIFNGSCPQG